MAVFWLASCGAGTLVRRIQAVNATIARVSVRFLEGPILHSAPPTKRFLSAALLAGLWLAGCEPSRPGPGAAGSVGRELVHVEGLGSLSFPNSGNEAAQEPFLRSVLLLHSFEFEPAAEAFVEAQQADPEFALAYWGEAMTYNHPLWRQKDAEAARKALKKLAPTGEERRKKAGSKREAMYLDALEALYGEGSKKEQDLAYMDAMRHLHETYPDDHEARAFYSLSILGSRDGSRDFATYMKAAAVAQPVFDANPNHPGAAHYIIHSFDDPIHAPLGLPAAQAYADIAPKAAHAQHMTTHIFVAMGMWKEVVSGNIRARDTEDAQLAERGQYANLCGHYSSWLHYGHLMLGETAEAEALMDACHGRMSEDADDGERDYFLSMRTRHVLDTEDWSLTSKWTIDPPADDEERLRYEFTNAFAALRQGNAEPARKLLAEGLNPSLPVDQLHLDELRGLIAISAGNTEAGLGILREAAEAEDSLPFAYGPPEVFKPTFELLGEELLRQGRGEEAEAAFRRANERTPGRTLSVRGLDQARETQHVSSG